MKLTSWFRAGAWMPVAVGLFAIVLALRIGRVVAVPPALVIAAAAIALLATLAWTGRLVASAWRGPAGAPFDPAAAMRCAGADAERVRAAALRRDAAGGAGFVRRAGLAGPVVLGAGLAGILVSGLLNAALHVEGTWVHFAASGKDLDDRATYRDVDAGVLANPSDLRYGVTVGEVRPLDPQRLADVTVVDARGQVVRQATVASGAAVRVASMDLYPWAFGPGIHLTVLQKEAGRLFDDVVPLWPAGAAGRYAESVGGDDVELTVAANGWPWPDGAQGDVRATLRKGPVVLYDGPLEPRKVTEGAEGYAVIAWELRPWVGLGVVHRTYRRLTVWSMAVAAAGALGWALLRPRAFRYREAEDGAVLVAPPSAWAALQRRGSR